MSMQGSSATAAPGQSAALSVTTERLLRLAPVGRSAIVEGVAAGFDRSAAAAGIITRVRLCHFLAQAAHETDRFRTLEEYGGPAYFARYDGRRDLGNTQAGDGARYRGRGIFQLTGRANYRRYGVLIGLDLEAAPERAKEPAVSLAIAFAYWRDRGCNAAADADDIVAVTRLINGGRNGLAQRAQLLALAKTIWV
ncbi:MAG: glycoside hydrolase family 19 protein [Bosea sp. (in: a-proteobacteria)]|uniref:glycoside hydrolase family 19 protein n=1 Tax=Bosea sp. (in: a-proteobacteria) TaxID=1871050 RepID=UPI0027328436|nr:glycoside hydrolase family 19 protein [Bosea sp. (in: a-proteobacteria)]MDP3255771.1 glycoside hydrolase family 19 protein [Bosea sp. (in: a-proteobacteria)]MDP3318891.1 glycoside hydrolase family 19 protein [Bosea sp. (in: a-proteobacteria)]